MVQSLKARRSPSSTTAPPTARAWPTRSKGRQAAGGQIVRREYTTDKANDFTAILTNIKGSAPDAIFYGGLDAQSGPMKRQLATLGLKAPLVSGEMTRSDTFIKLAGDAADGTYASLAGVPLDKMAAGRTSSSAIRPFKKAPGVYAPYAYDGAWNMITAIEQAGSAKPESTCRRWPAEPQGRHQREHRLRQERRSEGNLGHHLRSQERQVGDG